MSALLTSAEIAMAETRPVAKTHIIPPITEPMGRHWDQPSRFDIEIDATHALMSKSAFDKLHDYSCSTPTGVYPGKMWKCHWGIYVPEARRSFEPYWILRWFGEIGVDKDGQYCTNHHRKIIIS